MSSAAHTTLTLRQIFLSDGHAYVGRHGQGSASHRCREVDAVECVAGRGLRGDRFFNHRENYKGQVTLFAAEVFEELRHTYRLPHVEPSALRRNLIVSGADLPTLIGRQFELQGVQLEGTEECRPCYWMDEAVGPGAEAWLRGRGGLRCRILSDGWVRTEAGLATGKILGGAVLAGGASRRMGRDKAALIVDEEPLGQRQVRTLHDAGAVVVGLVRQPGQAPLPLSPGVRLWHDAVLDAGPLAGLGAALEACDTPLLAVVATDMPFVDETWFKFLHRLCKPGCGAIARQPDGRYEPLAAIYPRDALPEVATRLSTGRRKLQELADVLVASGLLVSVPVPPDEAWKLANWNTPADVVANGAKA